MFNLYDTIFKYRTGIVFKWATASWLEINDGDYTVKNATIRVDHTAVDVANFLKTIDVFVSAENNMKAVIALTDGTWFTVDDTWTGPRVTYHHLPAIPIECQTKS